MAGMLVCKGDTDLDMSPEARGNGGKLYAVLFIGMFEYTMKIKCPLPNWATTI